LNNDRIRLLALKKAEASDEVIVRLVEVDGKTVDNVRLRCRSGSFGARSQRAGTTSRTGENRRR
jgi:alpha-mannosidase